MALSPDLGGCRHETPANHLRYNAAVHTSVAPPEFLASHDALVARRDALDAELATREKARGSIADPVTREIARMFGASEKHDARVAHLGSLSNLVRSQAPGTRIVGASPRAQEAFDRAFAQGNYSALDALDRILDGDRDEEELALLLAFME